MIDRRHAQKGHLRDKVIGLILNVVKDEPFTTQILAVVET